MGQQNNIHYFGLQRQLSSKLNCHSLHRTKQVWGFVSAREMGEANSTSGPGSSEGRSSLVPWLSKLLLLEVPGATTEQVRTCGFKRNSSSFDKAPKIRDSVLLNSFESFLVTLPSISSETWEIYSWVSSGSRTLGAFPLLVLSGVSLETAANFLLFLNVAILLGENLFSCEDWIFLLYFLYSNDAPLLIRGKESSRFKQSQISINVQYLQAAI